MKQVEKLVERFNKKFPVGTPCPIRSVASEVVPFEDHVVRSPAYDMNGQAVAFFEGKSGCYSIEPQFVNYQS